MNVKVKSTTVVVFLLIFSVAILSNINHFTNGKSIYHINSIAASTLLYIKLQTDNFKNLNFTPQYWTNLYYTGGPVHGGLGFYNPLFLFLTPFNKFSNAIIFYDILLKVIGGLGIYVLLRKYGFSIVASLPSTLIYALNPYHAAFGQDPQFGSIVFFLPWIVLVLELIIENYDIVLALIYSLILSLLLSICYLSANIQSYTFLCWFIIAPLVLLRLYWEYTKRKRSPGSSHILRKSLGILGIIGFAFFLNVLLVLFEILPTWYNIQHGNRNITFDRKIILYSILLTLIALSFRSRFRRTTAYLGIFVLILAFISDPRTGTLRNPLVVNYLQKISDSNFMFDSQPMRYYLSIIQLALLIFVMQKRKLGNRQLILFNISLAYFAINILWIIKSNGILSHPIQSFGSGLLKDLHEYVLPGYYRRYSFIPFIGIIIGFAYGIDRLKLQKKRWKIQYLALIAAIILPLESYYLYMNRTLFTNGFNYMEKKSPEYDFLKHVKPTERVIAVYNDELREWGRTFRPQIMPKWLIPPYFGANTFTRMGVTFIPKRNALFTQIAIPQYFGVDKKNPLTNLLSLAGVKYIFSYNGLAYFSPTKQYLKHLRNEDLPEKIVEALKPLKYQWFSKEKFLKAVERQIGKEQAVRYQKQILKYANFNQYKDLLEQNEELRLIEEGDEYRIYENINVLPRIMLFASVEHLSRDARKETLTVTDYTGRNVHIILSGEETVLFDLMNGKPQDLLEKVYVSSGSSVMLNNSGKNIILFMNDDTFSSNLGEVKIIRYENECVEIEAKILEECLLILTDTFYPGWKAYLENEQQEIVRTDYIFRGVKLVPGRYTLTFRYESSLNRYSLFISFVSFLTVITLLVGLTSKIFKEKQKGWFLL